MRWRDVICKANEKYTHCHYHCKNLLTTHEKFLETLMDKNWLIKKYFFQTKVFFWNQERENCFNGIKIATRFCWFYLNTNIQRCANRWETAHTSFAFVCVEALLAFNKAGIYRYNPFGLTLFQISQKKFSRKNKHSLQTVINFLKFETVLIIFEPSAHYLKQAWYQWGFG